MHRTFNDETFLIAAEMVLRETKFFPTIKDLFDLRNAVYQVKNNIIAKSGNLKALPEETGNLTPEEIEQNQERVRIIVAQLSGEMSVDDAVEAQNKLTTWARSGGI